MGASVVQEPAPVAAGKRDVRGATPALPEVEGCDHPSDRIERYPAEGPRGRFLTTRCMDCGAHRVDRVRE